MTAAITTLPQTNRASNISCTDAVSALAALGNTLRLQAFRHIVNAGECGLNVGALQALLSTPASTLNHHLNTLVRAEIIIQRREGREIYNIANIKRLDELISVLCMLKTADNQEQGVEPVQGVA